MKYFKNIPEINYYFSDISEFVKLKNLFYYLNMNFITEDVIKYYRISGVKRIDQISEEVYGTTEYWWLLCLINDIQDVIFDLPLDEEILYKVANDRMLKLYTNSDVDGAMAYYVEQVDELIKENDDKRLIKIVTENHLNQVITEILKRI